MKRWLSTSFTVLVCSLFLAGCNPLASKIKSGIQVITGESTASVFINGQYLNKTPLVEKNLQPGIYTIRVEPDSTDLVPYETTVNLFPGTLTVLTWKPATRPELSSGVLLEMEKSSDGTTSVELVSIPENAITTIDGRKEFSPLKLTDLREGSHELQLSLPSYETQKHTINVQKGFHLKISAKLAKLTDEVGETVTEVTPPEIAVATDSAEKKSASSSATPAPDPTSKLGALTTASSSGHVKILKTGFFHEGKEVLRVRDFPGSTGKEIGFAPVGNQYPYLGQQKNSWYFIDFLGKQGWVNGQYIQLVP
ncbi:PEGA domain-containing protein [Candidatus Woesebacteria bacterium]|nr:PEGA domain-containing protein [Candidatus Woesebacteria bacterium]